MSKQEQIEQTIYQLLELLGEDPNREGLLDTPKRVAKMYLEMFNGLKRGSKDQFTAVFQKVMKRLFW
jgi:GTP cyclohydrolase I